MSSLPLGVNDLSAKPSSWQRASHLERWSQSRAKQVRGKPELSACFDLSLMDQELRAVRVRDRLPDKVSDGLISEVTFEFIPGSDQAA